MSDTKPSANKEIIEPKILKGFRDLMPDQEQKRKEILSVLEQTVRRHGFVPIDTPALEYAEVLLGKGGGETDKQVYRFRDNGDRDVSLRFDLTVPFARFMAAHRNELYLPFKRFHFAKVWRGENTQKGRYREFIQCDVDIVGVDSLSADFEILLLMKESFADLGIEDVRFHVSHRGIFNKFLRHNEIGDKNVEILRIVDKLRKIGEEETLKLLDELGGPVLARRVLEYVTADKGHATGDAAGDNLKTLEKMEALAGGPCEESERMRGLLNLLSELGLSSHYYLDPTITRGLDYYTGLVYETFLTSVPGIGSVCSGGRYNDLAGLYTKEALPGVGSSIGLDRLLAGLEELGKLGSPSPGADVLVACQDESLLPRYHRVADALRKAGFGAEVYPTEKKLAAQFQYAEKKLIPWVVVIGRAEAEKGVLNLKHLARRENHEGIGLEKAISVLGSS